MSNTSLKIIAIISMALDHMWIFLPESPYIFHLIGRISAPIFLFCCVQSYIHTSNKIKLFIRIYLLNVIVEIMNLTLEIGDLRMNFIRTILLVLIIIFIIDQFKSKNENAKLYLIIFIGWQIITTIIVCYMLISNTIMSMISYDVIFLIVSITVNISYLDGGILFVFIGVFMFIFKDDKTKLSISFIVFTVLYVLLFNTILICELDMLLINMPFINGIFNSILDLILGINTFSVRLDILWEDPQWMMIFSIPLILMYNGKKGISLKYLFYIFYPCHIAILYILSII